MSIHTETREQKLQRLTHEIQRGLNAFSEKIDALFYFGFCYLMVFAVLYFGWHIWGLIGRLQGWWL